jgi:glucose-6-phosphate isomerase
VNEALRADAEAAAAAKGRTLRFLANVDPVDVHLSLSDLDPARTMVIVISKTFTTAETMLNARTAKRWLLDGLGKGAGEAAVVGKHMVAVSTALEKTSAFGIKPENVFGFWDWVGGRYSVSSAVGVLPLSLLYSYPVMQKFLAGAHDADRHFFEKPLRQNIPVLMGLLGVWNSTFMGYATRALLP